MKCRLFSILSVLSLGLCALVLLMWLLSIVCAHGFPLFGGMCYGRYVIVSSTAYRAIEIAVVARPIVGANGQVLERSDGYYVLPKRWGPILGIYAGPVNLPGQSCIILLLPYWLLFLMAIAAPGARWGWRIRAMRLRDFRRQHQLCVACGYDLRASKGRCPECGTSTRVDHPAKEIANDRDTCA